MSTTIRPEVSENNKYYIPKHRYYELRHFCMQYPAWVVELKKIENYGLNAGFIRASHRDHPEHSDPTAELAMIKSTLNKKIKLVESCAKEADEAIAKYIIEAVTTGRSLTSMQASYDIPCGKDYFFERYRKFFWLLSQERE